MTKDEIARLRVLCEAASPGPFDIYDGSSLYSQAPNCIGCPDGHVATFESRADAEFHIATRMALPAVLDEIEALLGEHP